MSVGQWTYAYVPYPTESPQSVRNRSEKSSFRHELPADCVALPSVTSARRVGRNPVPVYRIFYTKVYHTLTFRHVMVDNITFYGFYRATLCVARSL